MIVLQTDNTILYERLEKRCARSLVLLQLLQALDMCCCVPADLTAPDPCANICQNCLCWTQSAVELFVCSQRLLYLSSTVSYMHSCCRGYTQKKTTENVECEIMQVIANEAAESYKYARLSS